jgi:FRG domain
VKQQKSELKVIGSMSWGAVFMTEEASDGMQKAPGTGRSAQTHDVSVATVEQLIAAVHALPMRGSGWVYRGQPDSSYMLVPKAGRPPFQSLDDLRMFDEWRRKAVAYLPTLPHSEWEALAIAQHHGLATRLLDWTFKYAVAALFRRAE